MVSLLPVFRVRVSVTFFTVCVFILFSNLVLAAEWPFFWERPVTRLTIGSLSNL